MNNFNWTNIISLNNSQNDAFEELLCQLAKQEPIENKKEFVKVGNPDGGVECYIILENDNEIGFQAKWFSYTPKERQWIQVEKSFKTAIEKHPKMIQYYVAIPHDRADPRVENRQSFMEKWDAKVKKWKKFARDEYNRNIEIFYWGSSEFITRLSREENIGLRSFFFGDIDLSNKWFKNQNELAIKDLGARYTPEINIELDSLLANFDALSRNEQFKKRVDTIYHEFIVSYRKFLKYIRCKNEDFKNLIGELNTLLDNFESIYERISFMTITDIDNEIIIELFEKIEPLSYDISELLHTLNEKEIEDKNIKATDGYRISTIYDSNIKNFEDYLSNLYEIKGIFNSRALKLVNNPYMILDGEAGIGKSHLLADIVTQRASEEYNSIFLLGQHFMQEKSPWSQILDDLLRLKCNEDEFLGALNAKAEAQNRRIIIFIDAINEGKGRNFWSEFLVGFIESIKQYKWLGLVLSIRNSYLNLIVSKEVFENNLAIPITHSGFQGVEYNASQLFFKNYNIVQPSIPLLHPEFSNPLFLKLFCDGLNKKGLTTIPDGYEGITNIIKFFIEGVETKLVKKYANIKNLKLIDKVIKALINEMVNNQTIAYDEAYGIVEEVVSKFRLETGLLDDLISEGLLAKNIFYSNREHSEGIYFAYERFEDHLKVKFLFDTYLDKDNPKESFSKEPLCNYFEEREVYSYVGIIEAMSIQLPEICNVELIDMVSQNEILVDSFLKSLLWRKAESISPNVIERLIKNIETERFQEDIFKTLFSVTSNPKHPLNANLLHEYLSKFSMRDRDVFFIALLNSIYLDEEVNPIKRLIDWAWSEEDKSYISDESLLLTSITLSWFLTTSNRQLRDYSTKALISLLQGRVFILLELLQRFENINEPYIYERLFAVAFGIVVRVKSEQGLKALGEYIYETIFNHDEVYTHILLRDYAKSTIDYINYLGVELDIDLKKIKPPYKSFFPKNENLPTNREIEKYEDKDKNYHQSKIISSMIMKYGDFGKNIFASNLYNFECKKNAPLISNYATRKIFEEYGYSGDFFDKTEKILNEMNRHNYNRYNHKIERIGNKYQWMAMHDTLARISDNFKMIEPNSGWNNEEERYKDYQGTYEPYVRDIDPTILVKETKSNHYIETDSKYWWSAKADFQWEMNNKEWINFTEDIPNPKNSIFFTDDSGQEWIALDSSPNWIEPTKKGVDKSNIVYKKAWYILNAYLIPNEHIAKFRAWAKNQSFWNNRMPKAEGHYQIFNREFYWSDAYTFFQNPYYGYEDWSEIDSYRLKEKYPYKIGLTTARYYWESEFDYSKEDSLSMNKPSNILFEGMKMRYSEKEGHFIDENGEIICFDPSIYHESNSYLMVRKDKLLQFLSENNLTVCWTLIGEKQVITPSFNSYESVGVTQMSGYVSLDGEGNINVKDTEHEFEKYNVKLNIEEMDLI